MTSSYSPASVLPVRHVTYLCVSCDGRSLVSSSVKVFTGFCADATTAVFPLKHYRNPSSHVYGFFYLIALNNSRALTSREDKVTRKSLSNEELITGRPGRARLGQQTLTGNLLQRMTIFLEIFFHFTTLHRLEFSIVVDNFSSFYLYFIFVFFFKEKSFASFFKWSVAPSLLNWNNCCQRYYVVVITVRYHYFIPILQRDLGSYELWST